MKSLTLLRHAKSSWNTAGLADRDRPLNKRGQRDAPLMGKRIGAQDIRPSLIISSPAVRAWTTARIIAESINYPREFLQRDERLYGASVDTIMDVIADQDPGFNNIMIVGHNPGLTRFANYLLKDITSNLPTCGVVSVLIDSDDWNLRGRPVATLTLLDYPKRAQ
ncbi:MAG: histidine phosphatase family protein [Proteobacteria bacterium]|nr:histidine phosphatase family protein [Pseudomonadota bacterium]